MGVLDTVARNMASGLCKRFGQVATLTAYSDTAYYVSNLSVARSETEYNVRAIVAEYAQDEVKGLVKEGDKKVLIAARDLSGTPDVSWTVSIGGVLHTVRHVTTHFSGDQRAMYELVARGP